MFVPELFLASRSDRGGRCHSKNALAILIVAAILSATSYARADDATVLMWGDPRTSAAEEAFILEGVDPPLLDQPVLEGRLRQELLGLASDETSRIADELKPPKGPVLLRARTSLSGGYNGSPGRDASILSPRVFDASLLAPTQGSLLTTASASGDVTAVFRDSNSGDRRIYTTEAMSSALDVPSILDLRMLISADPVVLDIDPEIRPASNWYRSGGPGYLNYLLVSDLTRTDVNVPYRGIATFLSGPFELRAGRDKLQLGPGRDSTLSFNASIPWADYAKASVDAGPLTFSAYYIRLNPYLTEDEQGYMNTVQLYPGLDADPTAYYELIHTEAEKNLAIGRITWRIAPWATLVFTQHDLVAGRTMQLSDFNPLLIWHNLFQEGVYGVPAMLEGSVTPIKGLRLYGQYLLYDANVADEVGSGDNNSGASAYQAGFSWLLRPFAETGPLRDQRIRLDAEATYTDPWVYGKAYSLRQFTSRFVFVEPYYGRFWVDYPIGPSFGPDCADLDLRLSLGNAESWNLALTCDLRESGSITLVGYGDGSDYYHQANYAYDGLVEVLKGQSPERQLSLGLEASTPSWDLGPIALSAKASIQGTWAQNYGFVPGDDRAWLDAGLSIKASYGR